MKKPSNIATLLLLIVLVAISVFGGLYFVQLVLPGSYKIDYPLTDEEYIGIANKTTEAQYFMRKYPDSTILVDRSGRLAVDYRVDVNDSYTRLRVFIDHKKNEPSEIFLDINGTYINDNILEHLYKQIEFQTISKGYYSGHKKPAYYVIKNEDEWTEIWNQHQSIFIPQHPPPEVNFSKSIVIAVFMGEFNTGGYGIEIKEILDMNQSVVVKVEKTYPGKGWIVTLAFSQPYHIVETCKMDKEITFDTVERTIECP